MSVLDAFKYPIIVFIFEKRANTYQLILDKAKRIVQQDGEVYYRLKKARLKLRPVSYDCIYRAARRNFLFLYKPKADQYIPLKLSDEGKFVTVDEDLRFWLTLMHRQAALRYQRLTWVEKWMPIILIAGTGIIIGVMIFIIMGEATKLFRATAGIGEQMIETAEALREAVVGMKAAGSSSTPAPAW